jgi:hypothetical protein
MAVVMNLTLANGHSFDRGGAIKCHTEANPTVMSCIISGGSSGRGGGIGCYQSSPTVVDCEFTNCTADYGGAIECYEGDAMVFGCVIASNTGNVAGGGISSTNGNPIFSYCQIADNTSDKGGGAFCAGGVPIFHVTDILGNDANNGGGIYNLTSSPIIDQCVFGGNSALSTYGGGMYNYEWSNPTLTNCTFCGNTANRGGAMHNRDECSPWLMNCVFSGNTAVSAGGGFYNVACTTMTLNHCTFSGNSAHSNGVMYNTGSYPTVTNSIFWGNDNDIGPPIGGSSISISYSCLQGGYPGTGNIDVDPLFVDADGTDDTVGTEDDNLHLKSYSPCINQGMAQGDVHQQIDMDGDQRVRYGQVDMGADEVFPIGCDYGRDEDVDIYDVATFVNMWLESPCSEPYWCWGGDINQDGSADLDDYCICAQHWHIGM